MVTLLNSKTCPFCASSGHLPPGFPEVGFPALTVERGNVTYGFFDMVSIMGSGIFVTPLIAVVENIAVCKAFGEWN